VRVAVRKGVKEMPEEPVTVPEAVAVLLTETDLEPVADTVDVREGAALKVFFLDTTAERVRMLAV